MQSANKTQSDQNKNVIENDLVKTARLISFQKLIKCSKMVYHSYRKVFWLPKNSHSRETYIFFTDALSSKSIRCTSSNIDQGVFKLFLAWNLRNQFKGSSFSRMCTFNQVVGKKWRGKHSLLCFSRPSCEVAAILKSTMCSSYLHKLDFHIWREKGMQSVFGLASIQFCATCTSDAKGWRSKKKREPEVCERVKTTISQQLNWERKHSNGNCYWKRVF